jgi:hypothetical protein
MKLNLLMVAVALGAAPVIANASAYDVLELPVTDVSVNQFGSSIDNTGLMLTTLTNPFNPPIDMTLFDVANFPNLTDPDSAAQGDFNTADYTIVVNAFRNNSSTFSSFGQKLASRVIYQTDGTDLEYVFGFDEETEETNGFTFGMNYLGADSANGEYIISNSASTFFPSVLTTDEGNEITAVIADFLQRGFVQYNNQVSPLMPIDDTLEGISRANAISENLQVAGISSVDVRDAITEGIETCNGAEVTVPLEICLYELQTRVQEQFVQRATIWQLDALGQVIDTQAYDLTFTPEEDDSRNFSNEAVDINNLGVAIGSGPVLLENRAFSAAMIYENGTTRRLIEDDDRLPNFGIGVNDSGIVVGYQLQAINGQGRAKFFTYDLNTETLEFPTDFFVSSSTFPRDINNNGIIVGDAEVDTNTPRRREAFRYDMQSGEFVNLNDFIACDSPYTLVAANSINDSNEIMVDATVLRGIKNVRGEVILDANGDEVLETAVVALKLTPNGGEPPVCTEPDDDEIDLPREGASNSLIFLSIIGFIALFRRFTRK